MIDEKKLIEDLEKYATAIGKNWNDSKTGTVIRNVIGQVVLKQPKGIEWIKCSKKLPEEPKTKYETFDETMEAIENEELEEYVVTISATAEKATVLYYAGDGFFFDYITGEWYQPYAWQPLPEPCMVNEK